MDENFKERKAVALSYNTKENTPKVVAKGKGYVAAKIIEKAKENNVAIYTDPDLAYLVHYVDIGKHIPDILYEIVEKVLTYIEEVDRIISEKDKKSDIR